MDTFLKREQRTKYLNEPYLRPVAEDLPVAAVGDELVWKLCHTAVQVVHYHMHDGGRLTTFRRIFIDGIRSGQLTFGALVTAKVLLD